MFAATYFRELAHLKATPIPLLNLQDHKYVDAISGDLLNPLFSSFVARDLASPAQKFKVGDYEYIKDRGYAFEKKFKSQYRFAAGSAIEGYRRGRKGRPKLP